MGGEVFLLCPRERVFVDPMRFGAVYRSFGSREATQVFEDAQRELRGLRQTMARSYLMQDSEGMELGLGRLIRLAPALGLSLLARVGGDVRICLAQRDATALAATWGRLQRLMEQAGQS